MYLYAAGPGLGMRLVLASDGVWDAAETTLLAPRIVQRFRSYPASKVALMMCKHAVVKRGGLRDDTTAIVVDIGARRCSRLTSG